MGWAFTAVLELKIDGLEINEYITTKKGVKKVFDDSLKELRTSKISLPDNIPNSIFFEEFSFYSQFLGKMEFKYTFDNLLGQYCFRNPDPILEILIYVAYISTKITASKLSLGIGDAGIFWMDAEFQNGRLLTVKLDDISDDEIDELKGNCFLCSESEMVEFFKPYIHWRIFRIGDKKEILNGLSDFINAMEEYSTPIFETEEFDDFYSKFSRELEQRVDDIFIENPEFKYDKYFILDLLEVLNLEKYYSELDDSEWFNIRYEDMLESIYAHFLEKDLDVDKDFIEEVIRYDPSYLFRINPKILDTDFGFRVLNIAESSPEKYNVDGLLPHIIETFMKESDTLRSDKKFILKLAHMESTGYFENHSLAELIKDTSIDMFNDKAFLLELIKISPYNIDLLKKIKGATIVYDDDAENWDWDFYYSRLSEDLQSDEKFINELKEIVNEHKRKGLH